MKNNHHPGCLLKIIIQFFSLIAVIIAFCCGLALADFLKSTTHSALGVPVYNNAGGAFAVGFVVYPLLAGLLLFLIDKTIGRSSFIAQDFGIPVILFSLLFYFPLLIFFVTV